MMGLFAVARLPWITPEAISGPVIGLLGAWLLARAGPPENTAAAVPPAMASAMSLVLSCIVPPLWKIWILPTGGDATPRGPGPEEAAHGYRQTLFLTARRARPARRRISSGNGNSTGTSRFVVVRGWLCGGNFLIGHPVVNRAFLWRSSRPWYLPFLVLREHLSSDPSEFTAGTWPFAGKRPDQAAGRRATGRRPRL